MVLNTNAMGLPLGSSLNSTSLSSSMATMGLPSSGLGANLTRLFSRTVVPRPVIAQPQNTGVMARSRIPALTPVRISSSVKGSSAKNFSISSSLVSAICSLSSIMYSSIFSSASAGSAISLPVASYAFLASRSTTPTACSPFRIGNTNGMTDAPNISRKLSNTLKKFACSSSSFDT